MISTVVVKELRESARDSRARTILGLMLLLLSLSLGTGWSTHSAIQVRARDAQKRDQAAFVAQGDKSPHGAAHFGRIAYKPIAPLATFDPGELPFLGQAIWLEAHSRNPARFRPAEDAPALSRLADLSVAGVLALLVPLLIFMTGYGAFAREREQGTLRQIAGAGARMADLFAGKLATIAGLGVAVSWGAILASTALAALAAESSRDLVLRGALLALGYGSYAAACAGVALLVSARARSASSALMVLVSCWAISAVVIPRVGASVAAIVHPTPESASFWADTEAALRHRPSQSSDAYRAAERLVLGRALGREVRDADTASLDLNQEGLRLEISEVLGGGILAEQFRALDAIYEEQDRLRRLISALSPTIALARLSSGLSGTDRAHHRHFALEAERQRSLIIRRMNEEMMLRGKGRGFDFVATADFWSRIPDFSYRAPPVSFALRSVAWDLLILAAWAVLACACARRAALHQSLVGGDR